MIFLYDWINDKMISEYCTLIYAEMISASTESTKIDFWVLSVNAEMIDEYAESTRKYQNLAYLILMAFVHIF